MLAKLEVIYLATLRIVVLVGASLALIIAGISLVGAFPAITKASGLSATAEVSGGTLGEFIEQQKITGTIADEQPQDQADKFFLPEIEQAAAIFATYLQGRSNIDESEVKANLQNLAFATDGNATGYAASLLRLANEVKISKGEPLTEEKVVELIDWHHANFVANASNAAAREAEGESEIWNALTGAATAFGFFVGLVFLFLFIKIERNLRPAELSQTDRLRHDDA